MYRSKFSAFTGCGFSSECFLLHRLWHRIAPKIQILASRVSMETVQLHKDD